MDGGSGRRPSWEREEQFRSLLHRAAKKASREMMDTIADIAIRDDKVAYKAVCALLLHEMKQLKPAYRLKLFFVASAILRQSKSRRGERDKYAPRFAPLLDTMADLLAPLPADQLGSVLKVLEVWWRDEIFPPSTVAALQKRFGSLLEAAQQGGGGASSSGGGGAAAAPALGMAASVTGVPAAVAPPPPPQLSSMSPGSLSGQAGAAAAGSSQGQGPAAAAAPAQASQVSKAAGGGTPVLPAAADSLSSRPPAAATANLPLHTVGSSSQLLRQQSTEAYDPFAPAMEQADPLPAAALPPFPGQSAAAPALPFPPQEAGQTLAGAWQQPQPHPKQLQGAGHGAWQYSQQQSPAVGAWQPPAPSPPKQQAAAAATWQQQQQLPASVPWQAHNMRQVGGSAWHAPSPTAPAGPLSSSRQDAGHSPAPPPPPPPPAQQESTGALRPQSSAQDAVHLMPAGQAAGGSHVPHPQEEEVAPPPPPPAEHPASKGPLPADVPAAAGVESAAGRAELHARRRRKSRWSDD